MLALSFSFLVNLLVAVGLGAAIGLERQWHQRRAGLRTNALVSLGAALFVMLNDELAVKSGDPTRIAAQVVSGIGFLGAGVIMRDGLSVRGLNTAATLWCSAAVGILAGFGLPLKAAVGTLAVVGVNVVLRPLAQRINRGPAEDVEEGVRYEVSAKCRNGEDTHVRHLILQAVSTGPLVLRSLDSEDSEDQTRTVVTARLESAAKQHSLLEQLVSRLGIEPGIFGIAWRVETPAQGEV